MHVTHKFRAECQADIALFYLKAAKLCEWLNHRGEEQPPLGDADTPAYFGIVSMQLDSRGDTEVEVETSLTIEGIRKAMRKVPDSHTMIQTLSSADQYTEKRDFAAN